MKIRILLLTMLPVICLAQVNPNGEKPSGELLSKEISPNEMKRNASFNVEEIKVRWKKAALENCTGVPCVAAPSFTCGTSTISDIDGNVYKTVLIGSQCFTKENLKVTKYNDGTSIPDSTNSTWGTATTGARAEYVGVSGYLGTYGYLYNWYAVNDSRKLCPAGWHVPTHVEWTELVTFLGGGNVAANKLISAGTTYWTSNPSGTNQSGFSALPGGLNYAGGSYSIGGEACFWSSTAIPLSTTYPTPAAWELYLTPTVTASMIGNRIQQDRFRANGSSVRCLKD
jgi:uncharacterized protein (TIGR02145 family)